MSLVASIRRPLWGGVTAVSLTGLSVELWHHLARSSLSDALLPRLSLSFEANLPTWFASSLLLLCTITALDLSRSPTQPLRGSWRALAAAFAWASLDEAAELHENLGGLIGTNGVLFFDWVIPAAVVVGALALAFWPWLRSLPTTTRRRMLVAAAVYFGGAVLMELPLGWWTERAGADSLGYALIDWVEETLELAGASLMLLALLGHREST
ncbi:MAG: hypothetical protein R3B48_30350 [Kofleriaceae bacterium]